MKQFKVVSLYFFLIVNLFSSLGVNAKSIVAADIVEGQQHVPNFLKKNSHFEKNANGVLSYKDAAATRPVDGLSGTSTLTCTRTTSSPLDGDGSLLITKSSANLQGEGCGISFTIDSAFKAKVLQIEFDYIVKSGTFQAGSSTQDSDLIVYLYDQTNSTLIEPSSIKLLSNSTTVADKFVANFQTSATGTTYNLILHEALTTSATGFTIALDNLVVKPSQYVYGTPITDWVAYTPTFGAGFGTVSGIAFSSRRVGDSLEVYGKWTNGTVAANTASISVGYGGGNANVTIDTTKVSPLTIIGSLQTSLTATTFFTPYPIAPASNATTIGFTYQSSTVGYGAGAALGNQISASGSANSLHFTVPIVGWSSSVQVSDGYDGRQIAAKYTNSSTTLTNNTEVTLTYSTKVFDSTANYSSGTYTVSSSGKYKVNAKLTTDSFSAAFVNSSHFLLVYQNGVLKAENRIYANITNSIRHTNAITTELDCVAGDTIQIRYSQDMGATPTVYNSNSASYFEIEKLQSPTTISATEVVAAGYRMGTGQTLNSSATIKWDTKDVDTHGMFDVGTGQFRIPVSGVYEVSAQIFSTSSAAEFGLTLRKDSTDLVRTQPVPIKQGASGQATNQEMHHLLPHIFSANAGQLIDLYVSTTTSATIYPVTTDNWISIKRIK